MSSIVERIYWEPGNASRYDLIFIPDVGHGRWFLAWMRRGGSGGVGMRASHGEFLHINYLMEKMEVRSEGDAHALVAFLVSKGVVRGQGKVWFTTAPKDYDYSYTYDLGPVEMGHRRIYVVDDLRFQSCQIPRYHSGLHTVAQEVTA